jgi:hypothetical protein
MAVLSCDGCETVHSSGGQSASLTVLSIASKRCITSTKKKLSHRVRSHENRSTSERTSIVPTWKGTLAMKTCILLADGTYASDPVLIDNFIVVPRLLLLSLLGRKQPRSGTSCSGRCRYCVYTANACGWGRPSGDRRW